MRFGRRGRFHDLVERQLDLFADDDAELLAEAVEAEDAWNAAAAYEAEEAYGDYQLVVDAIADRLLDIRESYAGTLDGCLPGSNFGRAPVAAGVISACES